MPSQFRMSSPGSRSTSQHFVIPAVIQKCLEAKLRGDNKIVVWGTGNASREFLYVEDAAEGILLAAEHYNDSPPVDLGSGEEITIREPI